MRVSTRLALGVAGAIVVFLVMAACLSRNTQGSGEQAQPTATPSGYTAPVSLPPLPVTSATPTRPGSVSSTSTEHSAPTLETVAAPADKGSISLYIRSDKVGIIPAKPAIAPAPVGAMDAKSNTFTVPPEIPGCPSDYNPKDPPPVAACDWSRTTVRIAQAAYPAYPSTGTTYIAGHACQHHICPFTAIQHLPDGSYTVNSGDQVVIGTPTGILTYRVTIVRSVPKHDTGPLPQWASDSTVPNRVVIVTCEYEQGDTSQDNIVIVATLVSATRR